VTGVGGRANDVAASAMIRVAGEIDALRGASGRTRRTAAGARPHDALPARRASVIASAAIERIVEWVYTLPITIEPGGGAARVAGGSGHHDRRLVLERGSRARAESSRENERKHGPLCPELHSLSSLARNVAFRQRSGAYAIWRGIPIAFDPRATCTRRAFVPTPHRQKEDRIGVGLAVRRGHESSIGIAPRTRDVRR
jgi:hypothetical protein